MPREQAWRGVRYQSARKPKLRAPALVVPPPIPEAAAQPADEFELEPLVDEGEPEELGLRVLAALESMPSLEPDYSCDLTAEASVTIIERAPVGEPRSRYTEDVGSLRGRLHGMGEVPDILPDEYAAYQGPIEEAEVEIVERPQAGGQNAACEAELSDSAPGERLSQARADRAR